MFSLGVSPYNEYLSIYKEKKFGNVKIAEESLVFSPGAYGIKVRMADKEDSQVYYFTKDPEVSISINNNTRSDSALSSVQPLSSNIHYKIISGVPDNAYTISCIPTAIGNVIGYWNNNGYPNLVTSGSYNMINEINNRLILISGNNTSNSGIPGATQGYCRQTGKYPSNFTVTNISAPSYSQMQNEITYNRPCLVGFGSGGAYGGAHMTTGVGYYYDDLSPTEKYVYVHDAWSNTAVDCQRLWSSYNDFISKITP